MNQQAGKQNLVISRVFDAPPERVWQAWTQPEDVKQWWAPKGFTVPLANMDVRPGGTSLLCMYSPDFGEYYSTYHYEEIVPLERIESIHNLADAQGRKVEPTSVGMPPDFPQDQRHVIEFKPIAGDRTEVTVIEYDWPLGEMMEMSRMGMNQCLDKMEALFIREED